MAKKIPVFPVLFIFFDYFCIIWKIRYINMIGYCGKRLKYDWTFILSVFVLDRKIR
jgi:hypothetical protein